MHKRVRAHTHARTLILISSFPRLQDPDTQIAATSVTEADSFIINVVLLKDNQDVSEILGGQTSKTAHYDNTTDAHADFSDLRLLEAGSGFFLKFVVEGSSLEQSTGTFSVAPFALRIQEKCYNNIVQIPVNIPFGVNLTECTGTDPDLPQGVCARGREKVCDCARERVCTPNHMRVSSIVCVCVAKREGKKLKSLTRKYLRLEA